MPPAVPAAGGVGDRGQRRAQRPQRRQRFQPGQRPGLGRGQVLDLLGGGRPARSRCSPPTAAPPGARHPPPAAGCPRPAPGSVQQHRPRIPGEHPAALRRSRQPRTPAARPPAPAAAPALAAPAPAPAPGRGTACGSGPGGWSSRLAAAIGPGSAAASSSASSACTWAEPAQRHRGPAAPAADGRSPHCAPQRPPTMPGPVPESCRSPCRAGPGPDQPGRACRWRAWCSVAAGDLARQPQRRRDLRAGEPDLPQRGHRDVPHGAVAVGEPEQRGLPGEDPRHPVRAQHPQVSSFWHALQDGRRSG